MHVGVCPCVCQCMYTFKIPFVLPAQPFKIKGGPYLRIGLTIRVVLVSLESIIKSGSPAQENVVACVCVCFQNIT